MFDRRDVLKIGAAAATGTALVAGHSGAQDDETPTETPTGTETGTPSGEPTGMLAGDLFAAARMTGAARAEPIETDARGATVFTQEDDGTLGYELYVAGIENVTQAHIHMAPEGESGPIVQWLHPSADATEPEPVEGTFEGLLASDTITGENLAGPMEGATLDDLVSEMEAGNTYVNVHTEANPPGEIRGQIRVVQQPAAMTPQPAEGTPTETPTEAETPTGTESPTPEGETTTPGGGGTDTPEY